MSDEYCVERYESELADGVTSGLVVRYLKMRRGNQSLDLRKRQDGGCESTDVKVHLTVEFIGGDGGRNDYQNTLQTEWLSCDDPKIALKVMFGFGQILRGWSELFDFGELRLRGGVKP